MLSIFEMVVKVTDMGLVIIAGGLWTGAEIRSRPKSRDEQTLISGTLWSQVIIPCGLFMSAIIGEKMDKLVQAFYVIVGILLLLLNGIFLVCHEIKVKRRVQRLQIQNQNTDVTIVRVTPYKFDPIYFSIGIVSLLASVVKLVDLILLLRKK